MFWKGKKLIYIGYISTTHGKKGKLIFVPRRKVLPQKFPHRVFLKIFKGDGEFDVDEFRVKLVKPFTRGRFILKLNKIGKEYNAQDLISSDVYIAREDIPRLERIRLGEEPEFLEKEIVDNTELEEVGYISRPHGLQGAVILTVSKEKVGEPKEFAQKLKGQKLYVEDVPEKGLFLTGQVRSAKPYDETEKSWQFAVKLEGVKDRNSAEKLRERRVWLKKGFRAE